MTAVLNSLAGRTLIAYLAVFTAPLVVPAVFVRLVGLGGLRTVLSYESRPGLIHDLDPRIKVAYPFLVSTLTVLLSWRAVAAVLALTIVPWLLLRPGLARTRTLLAMALTPAVGMVWSQGLFHPALTPAGVPIVDYAFPPTITWFGTAGISTAGMVYGAEQSVRMLVSVSSSLLLVLTTSPSDMVWAFRKAHLPAKAGFALSAALRFLPDLLAQMTVLLRAVEVRGLDLGRPSFRRPQDWPGYVGRLFACPVLVTVPLLIKALRGTATMAMVADSRAVGLYPNPTTIKAHRLRAPDVVALVLLAGVTVATVAALITGVGARGAGA